MNEREMIRQWIAWKSDRESKLFFQKDLAEKAGLSVTYLSNIMTGTRNPGTKTLVRIAGAFGITMAEFYSGPPQASPGGKKVISGKFHSGQESYEPVTKERADVPENTGLALSETSPEKIEKLFSSIGVSLEELCPSNPEHIPDIRETPQKKEITKPADYDPRTVSDKLPLLTHIPAGDWRTWFDGNSEALFSRFIPRVIVQGCYSFAVKVDDTSMIPDLHEGDLLIINPEDTFSNIHGGIGVAAVNNRFVARKIYIHKGEYMLVPSNPVHNTEYIPVEGTRIFKVALWIPDARNKF